MNLFIFVLLGYGITNILVFGNIFEFWRNFTINHSPNFFGKLFSCPLCLSMWVGIFLSLLFHIIGVNTPLIEYGVHIPLLAIFLDGCLSSGSVWLLHTLQEHLERE